VEHSTEVFVGMDVAKTRNAIAVADGERGGEVRFLGEVDASPEAMRRVVQRIAAMHDRIHFCYEAGPTGYGLHRLITSMGYPCDVVAPSLIPRRPGDRVKTNRRHAVGLPNRATGARRCSSHGQRACRSHRSGNRRVSAQLVLITVEK
jgi:transposase